MKTRKHYQKAHPIVMGSLMLLFLSMNSCIDAEYFPCVRPNGFIAEETRVTPPFTGVELRLHGQVFIVPGPEYSVVVETSDNLLELVRTRVSGGKLIIEQERCIRCRVDDINIYITMPVISEINLAGSGRIMMTDEWVTENLYVNVSGSGQISGSFISKRANTRISGSGNVNLKGATIDHNINISGSGRIDAREMSCMNAEVRISGSGNARIHVSDFLDARISGSGSIYFSGNPAINSSISGTGKIIKY
jgi:hypothetical protein